MDAESNAFAANRIAGSVYGPALQAGAITGDVHIHVADAPPVPAAPVPPPEGWADLPELPAEIRFLLRAQVQSAQELPYRLPGARRPALATVYVRQDLGSGSDAPTDQPKPTPILDGRGQIVDLPSVPSVRLAVRPPSRTAREALDGDDHLVVTGGPGQGKSTLSLRLAADIADRWMAATGTDDAPLAEPVVPLRLTARELATHLDLPFPEAVAASARAEYGALLGAPLDARVFGAPAAGCRWLLLVDGLDEVADHAQRDRLVTILAAWASNGQSPYRVVLTTRPIDGVTLAPFQRIGAARYELQPFDDEALRHFADGWFGDSDHGYRFVRQIRAAYLDELVRVPLLATIAAIIFEQQGDRPLPDNRYELYESYLKYLRSQHPVADDSFDHIRDGLLEHLGRVRLEQDTSLACAVREWTTRHAADITGDRRQELIGYLAAVGPFTRGGDGDLRFLHHSFAEHLAATAKARLLPERCQPDHPDFARLLHAARSEERGRHARSVLVHYTRLRPTEADRLLEWLHSGGPDQHLLAARLLAWHVPASVEVVSAFLVTVRAWAMTTQHPGDDILAQAGRATHHPGMAEWLADLMRDEDAPWQSRVEAATALATRLRGALSPDATAWLRRSLDDTALPVTQRLAVAEALSECDSADKAAAEQGLRSVLADPDASAQDCRTAALVLASLGRSARDHAVAMLTAMLDDPWTPDDDLVEAATGLVEIGVEFHERCAQTFRTVLENRTDMSAGVQAAATGLASLGHPHSVEAAAALVRLISDTRLSSYARTNFAETLAELGPQHRDTAAVHLRAMMHELDSWRDSPWHLADALATVGCPVEAVELLRAVLADRGANPGARLWAARTLADQGPEHHDEAAKALRRVADDPHADSSRVGALRWLAELGEPHRAPAVASLHDILADSGTEPTLRCQAGAELARLGPEFHDDVGDTLLEIATSHADRFVRATAWRTLKRLGTRFQDRASEELLAMLGPDDAPSWEYRLSRWAPFTSDVDDPDAMAHALITTLADPTRDGEARSTAAQTLLLSGRRFHRVALDGVITLLRSGIVPDTELFSIGLYFTRLGNAPRTMLAEALRGVARRAHASVSTVRWVAKALKALDYRSDTEIISMLSDIISDPRTEPTDRADAADELADTAPAESAHLATVLLEIERGSHFVSRYRLETWAALNADLIPRLRVIMSEVDVAHRVREAAAATVARICPDSRTEAITELRSQAHDELLAFTWRTDVLKQLAELDQDTVDDTVAYHVNVMNDESQRVRDRCEAAYQLARLDTSYEGTAIAALQRFATMPVFTAEEHSSAIDWSDDLNHVHPSEFEALRLAVARDPRASAKVRGTIASGLTGQAWLEVTRSLLTDGDASPEERVKGVSVWQDPELAAQAEIVLRQVLDAPDTSSPERIEAAAALADLSPAHVPEAVLLLEELLADGHCSAKAREELAGLSREWRRRLLADAERVAMDDTNSLRARLDALSFICAQMTAPIPSIVERLRVLASDPRVSGQTRTEMRYALRHTDGLAPLRGIRDDDQAAPEIRRTAANHLRDYDIEDRAAGARVLDAIARDTRNRPALRWRAASDLTDFGERGRLLGVAWLQAICADDSMPVTARMHAAHRIAAVRPDLRHEMLRFLHSLPDTERPRVRVLVLHAIGQLGSDTGCLGLCDMARDTGLGPGVRLRAATAMSALRRDFREIAAMVAREIARDGAVSRHIRVKAARAWARWSELSRAEAREVFVELTGTESI